MLIVEELQRYATEYRFNWSGQDTRITRYDNHDGLMAEWVVVQHAGPLNPHYLGADGTWQYKRGASWPTAIEAFAFLKSTEETS